jgi:hypothetical protein
VATDMLFPGSSIFLGLPDLLPRGERFCGQARPEQGGASPGAVAEIDQARPVIGPNPLLRSRLSRPGRPVRRLTESQVLEARAIATNC